MSTTFYHFPEADPGKVAKASASPTRRPGYVLRAATEAELAAIANGQTYWTPTLDLANKPLGGGVLSAPPQEEWLVLKETMIERVKDAGKLAEVAAIRAASSEEDKLEFDANSAFRNTNPRIIAVLQHPSVDLDPAVILARDAKAPRL